MQFTLIMLGIMIQGRLASLTWEGLAFLIGFLRVAWYRVIRGSRLRAGARVPELPGRERRDPVRFAGYQG
jgi:hypothetical protein